MRTHRIVPPLIANVVVETALSLLLPYRFRHCFYSQPVAHGLPFPPGVPAGQSEGTNFYRCGLLHGAYASLSVPELALTGSCADSDLVPLFLYFLFGTAMYLQVGAVAVVSLLTNTTVRWEPIQRKTKTTYAAAPTPNTHSLRAGGRVVLRAWHCVLATERVACWRAVPAVPVYVVSIARGMSRSARRCATWRWVREGVSGQR